MDRATPVSTYLVMDLLKRGIENGFDCREDECVGCDYEHKCGEIEDVAELLLGRGERSNHKPGV